MRHKLLILLAAVVAAIMLSSFGQAGEEPAPPDETPAAEEATAAPEAPAEEPEAEAKEELCAFDKALEGFECIEGLFNVYYNEEEEKWLLEIGADQLGEIYLLNIAVERGDGEFFDSGAMLGNFPFYFEKVGKRVRLMEKNVAYRASEDNPLARAIVKGVNDSVRAVAEIVGEPHPDTGNVLVDPGQFFIQDFSGIGAAMGRYAGYSFDRQESRFGFIKTFPRNTEVQVIAHYRSGQPAASTPALPDPRSMTHYYRYSLCRLPDPGYRPRYGDDRIGYFMTMYMDYDDLTADLPYKYYIQRWRLEKMYPHQAVSPPKKPIVYWLSNTIPEEYRGAVRDGILEWNKAFEKAGFKNAIVVKQMPDDADWDPEDIRYNVVQWIVMPGAGYAVGPSVADPFTGELYAADIRMCADMVRGIIASYYEQVEPLAGGKPAVEIPGLTGARIPYRDTHVEGKMREASFGMSVEFARSGMTPDSPEGKKFIHDAIKDLTTHEVGHTLGLRHNFKGSTVHSLAEMHDPSITGPEGVSGSVMDYNTVNIAPRGRKQGEYWQTTLGSYDYFIIDYGYRTIDAETPEDEIPVLNEIAGLAGLEKTPYGTDEDAAGMSVLSVDPLCNMWDMGDDPIAFCRERIEISKELYAKLDDFEKDGERYQKLRWVFSNVMYPYWASAMFVPKYFGGIYESRAHIGDPGDRLPFTPVPAAKQREAMNFLKEHIFSSGAFKFPPELMRKLEAERHYTYGDDAWERERDDYPLHAMVNNIQSRALSRMYDPLVLQRMLDLPLLYEKGEEPFTMAEMFQQTRYAIWEEVYEQVNVDSMRRNLQRTHLNIICGIALGYGGVPPDAASMAHADLVALRGQIAAALRKGGQDAMTQAHLEECLTRIEATLDASIQRGL